jgi:hypothetical protein
VVAIYLDVGRDVAARPERRAAQHIEQSKILPSLQASIRRIDGARMADALCAQGVIRARGRSKFALPEQAPVHQVDREHHLAEVDDGKMALELKIRHRNGGEGLLQGNQRLAIGRQGHAP